MEHCFPSVGDTETIMNEHYVKSFFVGPEGVVVSPFPSLNFDFIPVQKSANSIVSVAVLLKSYSHFLLGFFSDESQCMKSHFPSQN
jgi:hypothetical protein